MTRKSHWLRVAAVLGGLMAVPLTYSDGAVRVNEAACRGGTCCDEAGATCYPNNCGNPICSQEGAYWKDSGPCAIPE